jgi:hypothetical protein
MLAYLLILQVLLGGGSVNVPKPPGDRDLQWVSTGNRNPLTGAQQGGWKPPWFGGILSFNDGPLLPW